jgi:hypothetical protein
MKIIVFFVTLVFSISLVFFVRQQFVYPDKWNEIRPGMTRQEVYDRIGQGGGEMPGLTGMHWTESHTILKQDMLIYFDGNRAVIIEIVTVFAWETAGDVPPIAMPRYEHAK